MHINSWSDLKFFEGKIVAASWGHGVNLSDNDKELPIIEKSGTRFLKLTKFITSYYSDGDDPVRRLLDVKKCMDIERFLKNNLKDVRFYGIPSDTNFKDLGIEIRLATAHELGIIRNLISNDECRFYKSRHDEYKKEEYLKIIDEQIKSYNDEQNKTTNKIEEIKKRCDDMTPRLSNGLGLFSTTLRKYEDLPTILKASEYSN